MEIVLLGTGSADGWPNAFCRCASCRRSAADGVLRAPTAALVDDVVLLDCGPEAPRAALRAGRSLAAVRHVLLTHAHADHSDPLALLSRGWAAGSDEPLDVVGPPAAVEQWRRWVPDTSPHRWRSVNPGEELALGDHTVRVLAARHRDVTGHGVLYDLTGPDGGRLLYATDTGLLPVETVEGLHGRAFDVVLLEQTFGDRRPPGGERTEADPEQTGHLDLTTFPRTVAALREAGAISAHTDLVAVHLSHFNPPLDRLTERLAPWGARVVPDLTVLRTGARPAGLRQRLPRRTLVLGGARSGKSRFAEQLLAAEPAVQYVAPGPVPDDGDAAWRLRVEAHRRARPERWTTVETGDVAGALRAATSPVLVDCLSTWLAGVLEAAGAWADGDHPGWRDRVAAEVAELVAAWRAADVPVVAVSNEVGSGVVPATRSGGIFRDELGRLNQRLAAESEDVVLVVAGRARRL